MKTLLEQWMPAGGQRPNWQGLVPVLSFLALLLAGSVFTDVFLTERNLGNLLRQTVANGLISLGMLVVILTGGIDLSVGAVVALGGVLYAGLTDALGIVPALVVAVLAGAAAGLLNGVVIAHFRLQPFIVTLATMGIVRGVVYIYTESPISPRAPGLPGARQHPARAVVDRYVDHARVLRVGRAVPQPHRHRPRHGGHRRQRRSGASGGRERAAHHHRGQAGLRRSRVRARPMTPAGRRSRGR